MKEVRVITISREYGSGGAVIGQELANRLGWKLADRELILELARRADVQPSEVSRVDEHASSFIERLLKHCGQAIHISLPRFFGLQILTRIQSIAVGSVTELRTALPNNDCMQGGQVLTGAACGHQRGLVGEQLVQQPTTEATGLF